MSSNSKEACNTPKALNKTVEHKSAVIEDSSENILTERTAVLNRWTEHCSDRKHSMTSTPSPLVEGPYGTYNLQTISSLWEAAMVIFKTSPTHS